MEPMIALTLAGLVSLTATASDMKMRDGMKPSTVMAGGEEKYSMKNIVENAMNS